jgi:hypothetical protein
MSFFGRALLTGALLAGVVHVFRRDLTRILGALRQPTQHFIKEVQRELEEQKPAGSEGAGSGALPPHNGAATSSTEAPRTSAAAVPSAAAGGAPSQQAAPQPPPAAAAPPPAAAQAPPPELK